VVLILLSFLSLMTAVYVLFYRKWFWYCYHSSHWWQLCIYVLFYRHIYTDVISEMNDNNIRTTSCKREHIYIAVIIPLTDGSCVYVLILATVW
jgi:hypothetical protein